MKLSFVMTLLMMSCKALIAATSFLTVIPMSEFSLAETTNGLKSNFRYYYATCPAHTNSQSVVSETEFIKCPVKMCAPNYDMFAALEAMSGSQWNMTNITSEYELMFKRNIGPFSSARVTFYEQPNQKSRHRFNGLEQIESIISTAVVESISFDAGIKELERIKSAFEKEMNQGCLFVRQAGKDEVIFTTCVPISSGWRIKLSAKRYGLHKTLYCMKLSQELSTRTKQDTDMEIEVDI